jgi:hypothetical protein
MTASERIEEIALGLFQHLAENPNDMDAKKSAMGFGISFEIIEDTGLPQAYTWEKLNEGQKEAFRSKAIRMYLDEQDL